MKAKLAVIIAVMTVIASLSFVIYNEMHGNNNSKTTITSQPGPADYLYGNFSDLKINFGKDICVTAMENEDVMKITVSNPTDKRIILDNVTISVVIDQNLSRNIEVSYTDKYGAVILYYESFSVKFNRFFGVTNVPSNTVMLRSLSFSIVKWSHIIKPVYNGNYIEINGIRHNFSIKTYCPPQSFVIDPDDFEISFNEVYDFSDVVNNGIVTHNKTVTHMLTVYNPTYMNSTQFWLALDKLNSDIENDKFVVKAGNTFLYWNEYNNMLIKQLSSLDKVDIPISIAFVKGQHVSHSYNCELILYSGHSYSIPITVAIGD